MLSRKKKTPKFDKKLPEKKSVALRDLKSCDRTFNKDEPLEKQNMPKKKTPKVNPYRNEDFLKFVRKKECCVAWCKGLSSPHHLIRKNLGVYDSPVIKDGKYKKGGVVNLCPYHHNLSGIKDSAHQMGDKPFQIKFNVNFEKIAMSLWKEFER